MYQEFHWADSTEIGSYNGLITKTFVFQFFSPRSRSKGVECSGLAGVFRELGSLYFPFLPFLVRGFHPQGHLMTQGSSWNSNPFMHIQGQGRNISRWAKHCPSSPSLFKEHSWESCPFHIHLLPELSHVAVLVRSRLMITEEEGKNPYWSVTWYLCHSFLACTCAMRF